MLGRCWWVWALLLACCGGCAARATAPAQFAAEHVPVSDAVAESYQAAARPAGVIGGAGAEQLSIDIAQALRERGLAAESDGALAAAASWVLSETNQQRVVDSGSAEAAARHFGFGGVVTSFTVFGADAPTWRALMEQTPSNVRISRFGICVSPQGLSVAVVLGNMDMSFEPIPRMLEPGQSVSLVGKLSDHYKSALVFLNKPDGTHEKRELPGRNVNLTFPLESAGRYRLEVMGDGSQGPVIVSNLPLFVGVPEPPLQVQTGTVMEPAQAEARLLELLNDARRAAGVAPVQPDAQLRELALAHSQDMAEHHFAAHVSPSTGSPMDRLKRSGLVLADFAENIAVAATPESAHEGLMSSPGHRAAMVGPSFTHVGIGVEKSETGLVVTMEFGRRPDAAAVPSSAAQVEAAIANLRADKSLPTAKIDAVYRAAAQAGASALADGEDAEDVAEAIDAALKREVERLGTGRPGSCVRQIELLELKQLGDVPELRLASLRRIGVGAKLRQDAKGTRLATVLLFEGVPCGQ